MRRLLMMYSGRKKYSIEEIFKKELYFLLPYYFMRFEKEFKKGIGLSDERIVRDMDQIRELLYICQKNESLSEHDARYIMDLLLIVLKAVTRNMEDSEKRRLMRYMGGQVLELETDRIDAAIEKGRESMTLRATESLLEKMNPDEALEQLQWLFRISRSEAEKYIKQFV